MKISFYVTRHDLDHGHQVKCESCPVALSMKRRLKRDDIAVSAEYVELFYDKSHRTLGKRVPFPEQVYQFIVNFDRSENVDRQDIPPFRFTLEIPSEWLAPEVA